MLDGEAFSTPEKYYAAKSARYGIVEGPEGLLEGPYKWWLNGHLVCNTKGPWGTRGLDAIAAALSSIRLPAVRAVVINRRDFPLRTVDTRFSPLLWSAQSPAGHEKPLFLGLQDNQLAPVLSFYGCPAFADRLWPPPEHWALAEALETASTGTSLGVTGTAGAASGGGPRIGSSGPASWHEVPKTVLKAVFRGTLTGLYTDHRSLRLQLALLQSQRPDIFDVGLTAWTPRDRIRVGGPSASGALSTPTTSLSYNGPPDTLGLVGPLTPEQQAAYAIIVYAPGHCASLRLAWHLLTGCAIVVLRDPNCTCQLQWLDHIQVPGIGPLKPGTHYVEAADIYRLIETVQTLLADAPRRKALGQAAYEWASRALSRPLMASYTASLLGP